MQMGKHIALEDVASSLRIKKGASLSKAHLGVVRIPTWQRAETEEMEKLDPG